jgi:hypothetical protein
VRAILQANLACTAPAITAGTLRMCRTVAGNFGDARLRKLVSFYGGPDYAAFGALAARMERNPAPSAEDKAAMAKMMESYPLEPLHEQLSGAAELFTTDQEFMGAALKCAAEQNAALRTAGLKAP